MVEPLTDVKCRQSKYSENGKNKLFDGGGLFLELRPKSKKWRLKFRHNNKESVITLGDYPAISLAEARKERTTIKLALSQGIHPVIDRNAKRAATIRMQKETFADIAEEWFAFKRKDWSDHHYNSVTFFIRKDANKYLGALPVAKITSLDVLSAVRVIEARGAIVLASRVLSWIRMILTYATGTGRVQHNVAIGLNEFLESRPPITPHAYVTDDQIPRMMHMVYNYSGVFTTRMALRLIMYVFLRPSELVAAQWREIDFERKIWTVPASRMKGRVKQKKYGNPHLVPLSRQAIDILKNLHKGTGRGMYLFPSMRKGGHQPMSRCTLKNSLNNLGLQHDQSAHGFRSLASTIMNESRLFSAKAIDMQLSHKPEAESESELNYNHAQYLEERVRIMQWWGDYLERQYKNYDCDTSVASIGVGTAEPVDNVCAAP
jgi:integrase